MHVTIPPSKESKEATKLNKQHTMSSIGWIVVVLVLAINIHAK